MRKLIKYYRLAAVLDFTVITGIAFFTGTRSALGWALVAFFFYLAMDVLDTILVPEGRPRSALGWVLYTVQLVLAAIIAPNVLLRGDPFDLGFIFFGFLLVAVLQIVISFRRARQSRTKLESEPQATA